MQKTQYLFIGNGRLSQHLQFYFRNLNIPFSVWVKSQSLSELYDLIDHSTHILLLIPDSTLTEFYQKHLSNCWQKILHFSGALEINGVHGTHPLMTFRQDLYEKDFYQKIPFITASSLKKEDLLPGLPNAFYKISPEEKAYYHSLCVLGGNLTSLLIAKMQKGMEELGLPKDVSKLYVQKSIENVFENSDRFFTGPLARKDFLTVQKNLAALKDDPYQKIYESFLPVTFPEFFERNP